MHPTTVLGLRRSVIEVERKFTCGPTSRKIFLSNKGSPPFRHVQNIGRKSFEDFYYDDRQILTSNGIWLRRRNGAWQAKVRTDHLNSTFTNSRFEELTEPSEILKLIQRYVGGVTCLPLGEMDTDGKTPGLEVMARLTTHRDTWKLDEDFEVVLDSTDFGHWVGEVELERTIFVDDDETKALAQRHAEFADMDKSIQDFMDHYRWAFPAEIPVGKLSAYLRNRSSGPCGGMI